MIGEKGDCGDLISRAGPHCALGTIYYPEGEGVLLYIKSSLSGNESDYVINYKARYAAFPHETTGDQFLRGTVRGLSEFGLSCDPGILFRTRCDRHYHVADYTRSGPSREDADAEEQGS